MYRSAGENIGVTTTINIEDMNELHSPGADLNLSDLTYLPRVQVRPAVMWDGRRGGRRGAVADEGL